MLTLLLFKKSTVVLLLMLNTKNSVHVLTFGCSNCHPYPPPNPPPCTPRAPQWCIRKVSRRSCWITPRPRRPRRPPLPPPPRPPPRHRRRKSPWQRSAKARAAGWPLTRLWTNLRLDESSAISITLLPFQFRRNCIGRTCATHQCRFDIKTIESTLQSSSREFGRHRVRGRCLRRHSPTVRLGRLRPPPVSLLPDTCAPAQHLECDPTGPRATLAWEDPCRDPAPAGARVLLPYHLAIIEPSNAA
jgi:hypothetical protein